VRTGSITLDPNLGPRSPCCEPEPNLPLIPVTVQYDDQTGAITMSEGGALRSLFDPTRNFKQLHAQWIGLGPVTLEHCAHTIGVETSEALIDWGEQLSYYNPDGTFSSQQPGPVLTDPKIGGPLNSQATVSADGSTITAVWSDPILVGQNFTCFSLFVPSNSGNRKDTVIFAGYKEATATQPLTAHLATRVELRAMTAAANARHADGFNVHTQYLTNARVTNNGWADAERRFRRPSSPRQTQRGVFIVFHVLGGRWHVETHGSAVCKAGQHAVPVAVCSALRL
jgi:hypothetical protein